MTNDKDRDKTSHKAKVHLVQGIGHLWKAARYAADGVRSGVARAKDKQPDLSRSSVSKALDDAGKEMARAANNVAERIAGRGAPKTSDATPEDEDAADESSAEDPPAIKDKPSPSR